MREVACQKTLIIHSLKTTSECSNPDLQGLREEKDKVEATINKLAEDAAGQLSFIQASSNLERLACVLEPSFAALYNLHTEIQERKCDQ